MQIIYLLGSIPGGVDVLEFIDVGVTNMHFAQNLRLLDGTMYFVTVRGN